MFAYYSSEMNTFTPAGFLLLSWCTFKTSSFIHSLELTIRSTFENPCGLSLCPAHALAADISWFIKNWVFSRLKCILSRPDRNKHKIDARNNRELQLISIDCDRVKPPRFFTSSFLSTVIIHTRLRLDRPSIEHVPVNDFNNSEAQVVLQQPRF